MNIMEHFGKRIIRDIYSNCTGKDFNKCKYFNFESDDNGEFQIYNIYTEEAHISLAFSNEGAEILLSEVYNDK